MEVDDTLLLRCTKRDDEVVVDVMWVDTSMAGVMDRPFICAYLIL
jgi:hypothetical protein